MGESGNKRDYRFRVVFVKLSVISYHSVIARVSISSHHRVAPALFPGFFANLSDDLNLLLHWHRHRHCELAGGSIDNLRGCVSQNLDALFSDACLSRETLNSFGDLCRLLSSLLNSFGCSLLGLLGLFEDSLEVIVVALDHFLSFRVVFDLFVCFYYC